MTSSKNIEQLIALAALVLLIMGTYLVLRPFISALLWAGLLCYATWPIFLRVNIWLKQRRGWSAALLCLAIALVMVAPFVVVGASLADNVGRLSENLQSALEQGLPAPPAWVASVPWVGEKLHAFLVAAAADTSLIIEPIKRAMPEISKWLLSHSIALGHGILQLSFSVFILFFFYRDGEALARRMNTAMFRIGGDRARDLLKLAGSTVKGVVNGILGTAIAQGILAGIGFLIAGVPGALFLGLATFFLSVVPVGPPLLWLSAAAWLYFQGEVGWAIFMLVWGAAVVSSVDNFLKPYLISQGASLPFILVLLGVLGGLVAFGFVGVFIGPTLLAVGYSLAREWTLSSPTDTPAQT